MARTVILEHDQGELTLALRRLDRTAGTASRAVLGLDSEGRDCCLGELTEDGRWLLASGSLAHLYLDDQHDLVKRAQLVPVGADGEELPALPSTLGVPQSLGDAVPLDEFLRHIVTAVYALDAETAGIDISEILDEASPRRVTFRPVAGHTEQAAFVLLLAGCLLLFVTEETAFDFLGADEAGCDLHDDDDTEDPADWWEDDGLGITQW